MIVLGLDTATPATSVALLAGTEGGDANGVYAHRLHVPAPGERPGHATQLLLLLERVLEESGTDWSEVERLVVGTGPGTFTGLRIGIATARALAQARGLPLLGASTLRALADAGRQEGDEPDRPVLAVVDARRGEAFAAAWSAGGGKLLAPAAVSPGDLRVRIGALPRSPLAVGDGAVRFRSDLARAGAIVPEDDSPLHTVDAAFHCLRALRFEPSSVDAVLPDYLRLPDAELARRRAAAAPTP